MTVGTWALVGVLGGVGAVARFIVDGLVAERAGSEFPWGTLVVNLTGAALLGLLVGAAVTGNALVLAGTATLGSYTTLSTLMLETHRLGQDLASASRALRCVYTKQVRARTTKSTRPAANRHSQSNGIDVRRIRGSRARPRDRSRAVNEDCLKLTAYFGRS